MKLGLLLIGITLGALFLMPLPVGGQTIVPQSIATTRWIIVGDLDCNPDGTVGDAIDQRDVDLLASALATETIVESPFVNNCPLVGTRVSFPDARNSNFQDPTQNGHTIGDYNCDRVVDSADLTILNNFVTLKQSFASYDAWQTDAVLHYIANGFDGYPSNYFCFDGKIEVSIGRYVQPWGNPVAAEW